MLIGIVGAPNKGKSTLFSALTLNDVAIADYPFTTIDPNLGITYATRECPCAKMERRCNARNSLCENGTRKIPINIIDVAGLVEGAHLGKGMGNRFLNDIAAADALIIVADASGMTDSAGQKSMGSDPTQDIHMVENELSEWLASVVKRHMSVISRGINAADALKDVLTGMKVDKAAIESAIMENSLSSTRIKWSDAELSKFSRSLLKASKPYLIAANKMDSKDAEVFAAKLESTYGKDKVIRISAAIELALNKAETNEVIKWKDDKNFTIANENITQDQRKALEYMGRFIAKSGREAIKLVNQIAFGLLDNIIVYQVEDEHRYTDGSANVLPDAILLKKGSTAHDLAMHIHTDIADRMLYAIDAKKKIRIAKDHKLEDNDIIKIVSAAKR